MTLSRTGAEGRSQGSLPPAEACRAFRAWWRGQAPCPAGFGRAGWNNEKLPVSTTEAGEKDCGPAVDLAGSKALKEAENQVARAVPTPSAGSPLPLRCWQYGWPWRWLCVSLVKRHFRMQLEVGRGRKLLWKHAEWNKITLAGKRNKSDSGPLQSRWKAMLSRIWSPKQSGWLHLPEKEGKSCVCPPRTFSFTPSASLHRVALNLGEGNHKHLRWGNYILHSVLCSFRKANT